MRINNIHIHPQHVDGFKDRHAEAASSAKSAAGASDKTGVDRTEGVHGHDAVAALSDRLDQIPEVRRERVEQAKARLESGEYHSQSAVEETAAAILDRA